MKIPIQRLAATALVVGCLYYVTGCATHLALSTPTVAEVVRTMNFRDLEIPVVSNARYQMTKPPGFPTHAGGQRIKGVGMIRVVVDQSGEPIDLTVLDSQPYPQFGQALVDAARLWRYSLLTDQGGRPITYATEITVEFKPPSGDTVLSPPLVIGTPESSGSYEGTRR